MAQQIKMALNKDNCLLCKFSDYDGDEETESFEWFCHYGLKTRDEVIKMAPVVTASMICDDKYIEQDW